MLAKDSKLVCNLVCKLPKQKDNVYNNKIVVLVPAWPSFNSLCHLSLKLHTTPQNFAVLIHQVRSIAKLPVSTVQCFFAWNNSINL